MSKFHTILLAATLVALLGSSSAQQTPAGGSADASVANQINQLRDALNQQQQQIAQQQQEIERLRQQVSAQAVSATAASATPRVIDAAMHTAAPAEVATVSDSREDTSKPKESPISFRIGGADFTPGGFLDFSSFYRSVNLGSGIATSFNTIPFNNQVQGQLTEFRMTAQHSRISLKMESKYGVNDVTGYVEADFLGNDAANAFVSTNGHTNRMRHYWLDLHHNKWEILGGQTWSWLTPNRMGLSPKNEDIFNTLNIDPNYQIGLSFTRAAQFRVAYHPNEHWGFGVALENPDQYVGAGEVIYPFAWNALLGTQFDAANNPGTPNLHPDIIPKIAYDNDFSGHHFHLEAAGLVTTMKIANLKVISPPFAHDSATGLGGEFAANVDVVKDRVKLVANAFISEGGGRYIFGLGPDAVVRPDPTGGPANTISLVHSHSGVAGIEAKIFKNTQIAGYYGGAYFQRNSFPDITSPVISPLVACEPGQPLQTKRCIGFGGPNSPNSANRILQEVTFDLIQTFWKSKQYGALQVMTQYSWAQRNPWFVPAGAPKDAHAGMAWVSLRYIIP